MDVGKGQVRPVLTESIGIVTAEVYLSKGSYSVFIVGDSIKGFIGSFGSIEDCKKEIDWLRQVAESESFKQAVSTC